jgi:hypothetical protein
MDWHGPTMTAWSGLLPTAQLSPQVAQYPSIARVLSLWGSHLQALYGSQYRETAHFRVPSIPPDVKGIFIDPLVMRIRFPVIVIAIAEIVDRAISHRACPPAEDVAFDNKAEPS